MSNKILLATHQFLPKWYTGTEQLVAKTAKNFNNLFFDFEIMSAEPLTKLFFLPRIYSRKFKDYKVNIINYYSYRNQSDLNSFFKEQFKKFFLKKKIKKIIFFHTMRCQSALSAALELDIPYMLVLTDYFLVCPKYSLIKNYYPKIICKDSNDKKDCLNVCGYDNAILASRDENAKIILKNAKKILVSSDQFFNLFSNHIELKKYNVQIIDYGTDFVDEVIPKAKLEKKIKIGYFGSFIETKGILDMLKLIKNLDEKYEIVFCGSGPLKKNILEIKNKKDTRCTIKILKPIINNKLNQEISNIDIGILISKWPENNPLIINHFLRMGKPVIVSNNGTLPAQVPDKICGVVLKENKIENFINALNYIEKNYDILSTNAKFQQTNLEDRFLSNLAEFVRE